MILCEQVTTTDEVAQVAGRIRAELARPFAVLGHQVRITASVGVTVGDSESSESLLQEADRSMFAAKRSGRGRVDVYSEAWGTIAADQVAVHTALAEGLQRGELRAYYQPIVDLRSGEVIAREALVRWAHPQRGLLGPASFLDGADRSPLGVALGEKVLALACAAAVTWPDGCAVHVNVSARHLAEPGFVAFIRTLPRGFGAGAVPAGSGDHREPGARRVEFHAPVHRRALGHGGRALPRRLRHRILQRHRPCTSCRSAGSRSTARSSRGCRATPRARRWSTA